MERKSEKSEESFASSFAKSYIGNVRYFIKWTLIAVFTGLGVGAVGSAFALCVNAALGGHYFCCL